MAKIISRNPELKYEWWKKNKPKDLPTTGLGEALRKYEPIRQRFMAATEPRDKMTLAKAAGLVLSDVTKAIKKAIELSKKNLDKFGDLKKTLENYDGVIQIEKRLLKKHQDGSAILAPPTRGTFDNQIRLHKEGVETNGATRAEHDTAADEYIERLGAIASRGDLKQLAQDYAPKKSTAAKFISEQLAWSRTKITGLRDLKAKATTDQEKQALNEVAGLLVQFQQQIMALHDKWNQLEARFVKAIKEAKVKVQKTE